MSASLGRIEAARRVAVRADDDLILPAAVRDEVLALLTILGTHRQAAGDSAPGSYERTRWTALAREVQDHIHRLLTTGRSSS